MSTFKVTNVDKHSACSTHHEEYCDNFPKKFHSLMQFGPEISFCHFSQPLTLARHLLHLMTLIGDHYIDHCQHSHVHHRGVYASHKIDFFISLSSQTCCNMVNVSTGDFCSKTQDLIFTCCSITGIFNFNVTSHTLKKQTTVMPLDIMKWQNYFCDDNMSADKL